MAEARSPADGADKEVLVILKEADDKAGAIATLEALLARGSAGQQKNIKRELGMLRAGITGENESAYFLGFHFKNAGELPAVDAG